MSRKPTEPAAHRIQRDVGALGVMVNCLLYDSPVLRAARGRDRGTLRVGVAFDPCGLGEVLAFLPDGTSIRLEAVNPDYARGMTLRRHLSILGRVRGSVPRPGQSMIGGRVERLSSPFPCRPGGTNGIGEGRS